MQQIGILLIALAGGAAFPLVAASPAEVTIAQLSDTHLGESHSPNAADNLRKAVEMINERHPDAVILSGDMGERPEDRELAKKITQTLIAPVYYLSGNHEFHDTNGLQRYREAFGPDYYRFHVKNVEVVVIDSQLLGNYEHFEELKTSPLPPGLEAESQKMLTWLAAQPAPTKGKVTIAAQHIPLFLDKGFPDAKPYWTVNEPYAKLETDLLHKLGIKHLLAGHWHDARVFEHDGITLHVAPSTSWLPLGGQLGFDLHTISADGQVRTELVPIPVAPPK